MYYYFVGDFSITLRSTRNDVVCIRHFDRSGEISCVIMIIFVTLQKILRNGRTCFTSWRGCRDS